MKKNTAKTAKITETVMAIKAGVYEPPSVILPINQFMSIGEKAAIVFPLIPLGCQLTAR